MNMEFSGGISKPEEPIARTVTRAAPEGMENRSLDERIQAETTLENLVSKFATDGIISNEYRAFLVKSGYAEFVKEAVKLGIPTRFINSFLEIRGITLSKAEPTILRPKLSLTGNPQKNQQKKVRQPKSAAIENRAAKTDTNIPQQDLFADE